MTYLYFFIGAVSMLVVFLLVGLLSDYINRKKTPNDRVEEFLHWNKVNYLALMERNELTQEMIDILRDRLDQIIAKS